MSSSIKLLAPLKWALASSLNAYNKAASTHVVYPIPIQWQQNRSSHSNNAFRVSYRYYKGKDDDDGREDGEVGGDARFKEAVGLFNEREYYECHDLLETLWMRAEDPARTLFHGVLQCAVGLHHLFNQNHRGAMMELGEGLCKLRKMNFQAGPFHQFEGEIAALLDFIYQTQLELAACTDELCLQMDQSERSYQLLGRYAAGQHLYFVQVDSQGVTHIVFCPQRSYASIELRRVKLPTLQASDEHLLAFQY